MPLPTPMDKSPEDVSSPRSEISVHNYGQARAIDGIPKALHRRILLKTDCVVLPLIVLTSTLAFLDKVLYPH